MKTVYRSVVSAFMTFSIIPMPMIEWSADNMRGLLSALPLIGVVIGGLCYLYTLLAGLLALPAILSAVVLTILPIAISGGIHMDGFADTIDALKSYAPPEKKRAILKDPHAGAFAILGVCCYVLFYFGLCAALPLDWKTMILFGITHVLARAVGAMLSLLPISKGEGMLRTFHEAAAKPSAWILLIWIFLCLCGAAVLSWLAACVSAPVCVFVYLYVRHTAKKQFGGMSGDLAGFGISLCSIALLLGLVLSERVVTLWF